MSKKDFVMNEYVKEVLQDELLRNDAFLTEEEIKTLLAEDEDKEYRTRETIIGYPIHPLYRELGNMLTIWMQEKYCPALNLPKYDLLDEKTYAESRHCGLCGGGEEIKYRIREVLLLLGKRGILDLFGIRKTVGTKEIWPVSKEKLIKSFKEKHSPNSELWVGARALAKHFHRDNSNSWWGTSTGTEMDKNEHALKTLNKIMDNATWINIHWLPHDVIIVEMRQEEGYGARWLADGSMFRGFLEPPDGGAGHDVGWRH
ncbi:uncharacterized protein LOC124276869 [Haliotis rubra]|uniref:uncharacterized protein LOC124276869 n=1 Tax=Haliotis rubra TaxID=36100 RepID=UPI001EE5B32D|nr:uncharacterized protein LOC124276869 [Haliotis rubra]